MLYCNIGPYQRLTVWHRAYEGHPTPSLVHNHAWDFVSLVLAGEIANYKYEVNNDIGHKRAQYNCALIDTSDEGKLLNTMIVQIKSLGSEIYSAPAVYQMKATEFHKTFLETESAVTLVTKFNLSSHRASVIYPEGTEWISAKPHPASDLEKALALQILESSNIP